MRVDGWESRLAGYLEQARHQPFAWGENDCALWSARWVRTATGRDFLPDWRGRYSTRLGAVRLMKRRGYDGVEDIADAVLPPVPPQFARRGDLVLHPQGALGICAGRLAYFLGEAGPTALETAACPAAWKVD